MAHVRINGSEGNHCTGASGLRVEEGHGSWTYRSADRQEAVYVREYEAGRLIREHPISAEELQAVFGRTRRRPDRATRRFKQVCT